MTQCIVTSHQWKDLEGWKDYGISLSTPSNEAAKMLDALVTQEYNFTFDESLGGILGAINGIREADPDYVLGPLFESRFKFVNHRLESTPELQASLKEMEDLAKTQPVNEWEMKLVGATKDFATGYRTKSLRILEQMVIDNPRDVVSLHMAYMFALILGDWTGIKTIMPKVVANWTPDMAFYGYIHGMYGFVLNEFKQREEAEKHTKKALNINPCDSWSNHATAHILLESNRCDEGLKFMEHNRSNWTTGTFLLAHNYWHLALFYLEKRDIESVLDILDNHIISQCSEGTSFPLCDAASILYRLEMEGVPTGNRWQMINSFWYPSEPASVFVEVHMMMNYLGAKDYDSVNSLYESCEKFAREGKETNWKVTKDVGLSLCDAMMEFDKANYDDVVELLLPVRDDVIRIGGSNAQRDVFDLLLTWAAIQCSANKYRNLGRQLIEERKQLLGENGITEKLEERLFELLGTK